VKQACIDLVFPASEGTLEDWKLANPKEHAYWLSIGSPSIMIYNRTDRRIANKLRGTVPWDEPYERREQPHNY